MVASIGKTVSWRATIACVCFILSACVESPPANPGLVSTEALESANQQDFVAFNPRDYILRPADKLQVTVFREPDLSLGSVTVSASGQLSLPLLGQLEVAGLTTQQFEEQLEAQLGARYLRDPDVSVNVLEYGSHKVTVEGAVTEPGIYEFQPGTRLSGGISMARGPTRVARYREVAVFRQSEEGMQVAKFNLAALRAGTMPDPILQPGDRIVVGTDNLAQFWQDLLRALPAFGLFTQI